MFALKSSLHKQKSLPEQILQQQGCIHCCCFIIQLQGSDNCRECPILPRHYPRVSPDLVIGGEITERSANRTARRRRSRQGLHLHVGMSAYHAHRGHGLGGTQCTHWVPAVVGLCASPLAGLSFCFPPEYKFISSPVELQSEPGGQTSTFSVLLPPC